MKLIDLAWSGARHHWRSHAGVFAGATLGTAILVGALAVGDSVRATLRARALAGVGRADLVLFAGERSFRSDLAQRLESELDGSRCAALIRSVAALATPDGARRRSGVALYGVERSFYELAPSGPPARLPGPGEVLVNEALAGRLGLAAGDRIVLRVAKGSGVPRELALSARDDLVLALSVTVAGVLPAAHFGDFALGVSQVAPDNAFVDRTWLAERLDRVERANLLLAHAAGGAACDPADWNAALRVAWIAADADLEWRSSEAGYDELTSGRILIEDPVARALAQLGEPALGVFTYFVNALRSGERSTPYSTLSGIGPLADSAGLARLPALDWASTLPADLAPEEIVLADWLAEDLGVGAGDGIEIDYYAPGETFELEHRTRALRVRAVVPVEGRTADPTLMPDFPGIAGEQHCRDWEPGIPMDLSAIRERDEQWWEEHGGTPKAYLSLAGARAAFANRYGSLTAVRVPSERAQAVRAGLVQRLDPASSGLFFEELRARALESSDSPTDFGGLFLALSAFLIVSAGLLTAMSFSFAVEGRAAQVATLRALGWRPRRILALLLLEGLPLALGGALIGVVLGLAYTRAVLVGLATVWKQAVGGAALVFDASPGSMLGGGGGALLISLLAMLLAVRRLVRLPVLDLFASRAAFLERSRAHERRGWLAPAFAAALAAASVVLAATARAADQGAAMRSFASGGLLLVAGLLGARAYLARRAERHGPGLPSVLSLGALNATRRPGRSLATLSLIAFGVFLVASVVVHRRGSPAHLERPSSGSGGFELIGRSALPILEDPNTERGREALGLAPDDLVGVEFLPLRVRDGDDASCLNLAAPRRPRLLGVDPRALAERGAFTFLDSAPAEGSPWARLEQEPEERVVPAVGDAASLQWQLHRSVGDDVEYRDEAGRPFRVRIVGALVDSILQGSLVIAEHRFRELYPSESGYRSVLVDVRDREPQAVLELLGQRLADIGLELEPTARRLEELAGVQNTYIEIFQVLGSLGLLLGTVGLGLSVLQGMLERRSELALLRAVGFGVRRLGRLVFVEHALTFLAGLGLGLVAAVPTLLPSGRGGIDPGGVIVPLLALATAGAACIAVAARRGISSAGPGALRGE